MLVSYIELLERTQLNLSVEEVVNTFNQLGFEVERVTNFPKVEGLRFGQVLETWKNPNADKLTVCRVKFLDRERTIQTAATNVREGDFVVGFVEGSKRGDIVYEKKNLKGIDSEGMMASWEELGFGVENLGEIASEGVVTLEHASFEEDPIKVLKLNDSIIEITVLSNRREANSYSVLVNEFAAYFDKLIDTELNHASETQNLFFEVDFQKYKPSLEDVLFVAKHNLPAKNFEEVLRGLITLNFGLWNRSFHSSQELENLNNPVSNFLETLKNEKGVCDCDDLPNFQTQTAKHIFVVPKIERSKLKNADSDLFDIASLWGIVLKQTSFIPTQAIKNFIEKKVGKVVFFEEKTSTPTPREVVDLDLNALETYVGIENVLETSRGKLTLQKLQYLGYQFLEESKILIPFFRNNIHFPEDFVEEFVRFFGYDHLQPAPPKILNLFVNAQQNLEEKVSLLGYQEVSTFTLVDPKFNNFDPFNFQFAEELINCSPNGRKETRKSIFNTMVEVLDYNLKRKMNHFSIFDIGMVATEKRNIMLASTIFDFYSMKQQVISLFPKKDLVFERVEDNNPFLVSNLSAYIKENDKVIGWIGRINPLLFEAEVCFCEMILEDYNNPTTQTKSSLIFQSYNPNSLKHRSVTFLLEENKGVGHYYQFLRQEEGVFKVIYKETYESSEGPKVTFDILIEEGFEKSFDQKYA